MQPNMTTRLVDILDFIYSCLLDKPRVGVQIQLTVSDRYSR
jgi:hypothetical protein